MITLNLEQTIALAEEIVGENPDYIYERPNVKASPACLYVHGDTESGMRPGCVVGHILAKAGLPLEEIAKFDAGGDTAIHALADNGLLKNVIDIDERSIAFLRELQSGQDFGETWATALSGAKYFNKSE